MLTISENELKRKSAKEFNTTRAALAKMLIEHRQQNYV